MKLGRAPTTVQIMFPMFTSCERRANITCCRPKVEVRNDGLTPTTDICMVVHNDVTNDSRVLKEAASLAAYGWKVVVVGLSLSGRDLPEQETCFGFTILRVKPPLLRRPASGRMQQLIGVLLALVAFSRRIRQVDARIYHGHDFTGLFQLAMAGIWQRPIVYDSHELFFDRPFADLPLPVRLLVFALRPLEKILARRAVGVITVSNAIAERLAQTLSIPRPIVLYNAVDIRNWGLPAVSYSVNRRKTVVHSGNLVDTRHLPELVEAISRLDNVALVLMGDGPLRSQLLAQAESLGIGERVLFVSPVKPDVVAPTLAQADVAAVLTTATITNHNMTIGNKFFEAIAAGLPLVTGPNIEIAQLMKQYDLGIICNPSDPASIANAIATLLEPERQARYRANAQKAREILNWEHQEHELLALYERLLGKP